MRKKTLIGVALLIGCLGAAVSAHAQVDCNGSGPDAVIGDITQVGNYASLEGVEAFAVGQTQCNIGTAAVQFSSNTNRHPIIVANMYRLKTVDGSQRFEQVGMSWAFHTFCALGGMACCPNCQPGSPCGDLGPRCSSPDTAGIFGSQTALGPRWEVNAATGEFPFPPTRSTFSGSVARRLQVHISDLDPQLAGGGQYFVECVLIASDDATAGNSGNNASYRRCTISGGGENWNVSVMGPVAATVPALQAWSESDPQVTIQDIDVPGDGRFTVAARATALPDGRWHYEYAVHNLTSDRAARMISVVRNPEAIIANLGFHDVDYHSGDGEGNETIDGTDWPATTGENAVTWSTETYEQNHNANALRWATLYNFRFDSDAPPVSRSLSIGFFKPGEPDAIDVADMPAPGLPCIGDVDGDRTTGLADLATLLSHFGQSQGATLRGGDLDLDGVVGLGDLARLLGSFGVNCP